MAFGGYFEERFQGQMVGGFAVHAAASDARLFEFGRSPTEDSIQRAQRSERWECSSEGARTLKSAGEQVFRSEVSVEVVQIPSNDRRCASMHFTEWLEAEEALELLRSFGSRQAEVEIRHPNAVLMLLAVLGFARENSRHERAPLLSPAHRKIEVTRVSDREATQREVAVAALFVAVLVPECVVIQLELSAEFLHLVDCSGAGPKLSYLLEQDDVGRALAEKVDHAFESITTVESADPFVDVPRKNAEKHCKIAIWRLELARPSGPWISRALKGSSNARSGGIGGARRPEMSLSERYDG